MTIDFSPSAWAAAYRVDELELVAHRCSRAKLTPPLLFQEGVLRLEFAVAPLEFGQSGPFGQMQWRLVLGVRLPGSRGIPCPKGVEREFRQRHTSRPTAGQDAVMELLS